MLSIYEFLLHFCAIYAYQIWFDKNALYYGTGVGFLNYLYEKIDNTTG